MDDDNGGKIGGIETFRGVVFPWHCDMMGHMSVQHQVPLLDNAVYHLLGAFGPAVLERDGHRLGWADISHEIRYLHELVAGDLLILHSGIVSVGTSSLRHRTVLIRRSDGRACTMMEGVTVRFDLSARKSTPLSDADRAVATGLSAPALP
ncbi:acyl-CoA thioesterase [Sphingomonas sp. So64.6b]|uniref:acyl-CoA thioesterase n=1 Tax=Sphingomonas sp. So64.6b TaxID=2997354 RepID=UPI0016005646|nr:acyl-CoA thioesterase [Sphingomonas sp. So64.6b]QNA86309.1 acyl-CoA thioesterase [Sphingomonas sp. So64.6b]